MSDVIKIYENLLNIEADFIADLNRSQLINGKMPDGSDIQPDYSPFTVKIKMHKTGFGGIYKNVTLYDTGRYHKSIFSKTINKEIFMLAGDLIGQSRLRKYGKYLNLTKQSQEKLRAKIDSRFYNSVENELNSEISKINI